MLNGIECHFPTKAAEKSLPKIHQNNFPTVQQDITSFLAPEPPIIETQLEESHYGQVIQQDEILSNHNSLNVGDIYQPWDLPHLNFADLLNTQTINDFEQDPILDPPSPAQRSSSPITHLLQTRQSTNSFNFSIPPSPASSIRILTIRPRPKPSTQRIANLLFHNLKSFPLMLSRQGTLPPFIHPNMVSSDGGYSHVEPLTNCISLVHMISSGIQGSRKLFWKNVRLECERLCAEHRELDSVELVAGMQALAIYMLIRLDEGETADNNLDSLLVTTVIAISIQLSQNKPPGFNQLDSSGHDLKSSWEAWLHEESRRRLSIIYRALNMLIYFEPSSLCELQSDLILAPLPAKKQLWEATTEIAWKAELDSPQTQKEFGLASDGELVKLMEGQKYCGNAALLYEALGSCRRSAGGRENWEEWCLGMDGFGGLVMLAASLVE
ncbi:hypothetical protein ONS96_009713 [Cadophora gregata f. sp. sojae]|nr:hypothetical protein ONS96_009713 [Cadophora gregata f. sp. sojae]